MSRMDNDAKTRQALAGLSGRSLAFALLGKYAIFTIYGVWAAIVEIPTFVIIGSSAFAVTWAILVALFASMAAFGVGRTWKTGRSRFEYFSTGAFILTFIGYSFALVWRSIDTGNPSSAPLSLIPVAVCILPAIQLFTLSLRVKDHRS